MDRVIGIDQSRVGDRAARLHCGVAVFTGSRIPDMGARDLQ
jgi:hypothetical protein